MPPLRPSRVLTLFLHLQQQIDGARLGILVGLGILVDLERFEVLQLVEAQKAVLPQLGVVTWPSSAISSRRNDAVAGDGVAWNSMRETKKRLAFVDIDHQRSVFLASSYSGLGMAPKLM